MALTPSLESFKALKALKALNFFEFFEFFESGGSGAYNNVVCLDCRSFNLVPAVHLAPAPTLGFGRQAGVQREQSSMGVAGKGTN